MIAKKEILNNFAGGIKTCEKARSGGFIEPTTGNRSLLRCMYFCCVHTSSLAFVLPKKKGGNNAAFPIAPRRQWGKKENLCVQSNRRTKLNLPLVFSLACVQCPYHNAFIFYAMRVPLCSVKHYKAL